MVISILLILAFIITLLLIPLKVSLKAEKEDSFWYLLSISYLNIFSIAFSPKGRRVKIGFMSFIRNNPTASPSKKAGQRGIIEGGIKKLIDGLKIFKNVKPYFKVEKMKVDGEVGFENIFLTGLVPLSISILKDFFAEDADVSIRPDYFNEGFKGRMEFSGSIRMAFVFMVLGRNILNGGVYV